MNMFRTLYPDEIDCRISQIKEYDGNPSGLSLLLYKDARCDQNILDETVGPMKWKREHTRDNRNCIVSIWSDELQQWVSKEDTGTESNTEREKGLASDSFKRACFNWGVGRELYTAPYIYISASKCNIKKDKRGKWVCYDNFTVTDIEYMNNCICYITIKNEATGKECFKWGSKDGLKERPVQPDNEPEPEPERPTGTATVETAKALPQNARTFSPVANFIRNEIADIQEKVGYETYDEAKKQVVGMAKALIESGTVKEFDWKLITMQEAVALFTAIRKLLPPGDAA